MSIEILQLEGRGLDKSVAEMLGYTVVRTRGDYYIVLETCEAIAPKYSTDIAPAFQVVDKMLLDGLSLELIVGSDGYTMASFLDLGSGFEPRVSASKYPTLGMPIKSQMVSQSIPEAICKAALLTKLGT